MSDDPLRPHTRDAEGPRTAKPQPAGQVARGGSSRGGAVRVGAELSSCHFGQTLSRLMPNPPRRPALCCTAGLFFLGRVGSVDFVVFMDWQNVYKRAREIFHDEDVPDFTLGQVYPAALAGVLMEMSIANRPLPEGASPNLAEIRIYRGKPDQRHDPKGYAAFRRQVTAWSRANNRVKVIDRVLKGYPQTISRRGVTYETKGNVREKGIDVALALDVVTMAIEGRYDRGIIFSGDHDIAPAVEYVLARPTSSAHVEVAAWRPDPPEHGRRLNTTRGPKVYCHWLDRDAYRPLCDQRDYTLGTDPSSSPRPSPR